jgi:hypothetical protein
LDASRFDSLARSFTAAAAPRRSLIAGLVALSLAALPMSDIGAKKKKKKRCKRKKRCGKDCCNASSCFAKSVNDDNSEVLSFGCCPAKSLCKSVLPNFPDQCCYPDEVCDPQLAVDSPEKGTICCRQCGDSCLESFEECVDGVPTPLLTARLPRYRR